MRFTVHIHVELQVDYVTCDMKKNAGVRTLWFKNPAVEICHF